jgi:hypothetical protein
VIKSGYAFGVCGAAIIATLSAFDVTHSPRSGDYL